MNSESSIKINFASNVGGCSTDVICNIYFDIGQSQNVLSK